MTEVVITTSSSVADVVLHDQRIHGRRGHV